MNDQEFSTSLQKYADVVVRIGLNLRAGQRLLIFAGIFDYPLVRKVVASAYNAGARYVDIIWDDEESMHVHLNHAPYESLSDIPDWSMNAAMEFLGNGDAYLGISSANPDVFADVDPDRVTAYRTANLKKFEKVSDIVMRDAINWCIVSSPTKEWAAKIFPNVTGEQAMEKLWEAIFQTCRVDTTPRRSEKTQRLHECKTIFCPALSGSWHRPDRGTSRKTALAVRTNESRKRYRLHSQHAHRGNIYHATQG